MLEQAITSIGNAVGAWLYVIAGGLAFAEAAILIGMVLPGETGLLVAGVFCQRGVLTLWVMIPVAIICAIAGDTVGFEFGRKYGPPLRRSRLGLWVGDGRWSTVDGFLHRHGGKAIFLGRLTAVLRALVPSVAGMSGMHYPTFLRWNAAGGILCPLYGEPLSHVGTVRRNRGCHRHRHCPARSTAPQGGRREGFHDARLTQRAFPSVESLR
jgi:membrane protein DedA with SNARE-associated domain